MNLFEHLITVSLYIKGDNLDPNLVTQKLQLLPTRTKKKGNIYVNLTGNKRTDKNGSWCLEIEQKSLRVEEHIQDLLNKLKHIDTIPDFKDMEDIYLDILVVLNKNIKNNEYSFNIDHSMLKNIYLLGIPIQTTISYIEE
jgi:hypothetical protein